MHSRDIAAALEELRQTFEREDIPFAVIGALALRQHGYARHTEDIDLVTTPAGLARVHERLVGRGIVPQAPGLRKRLKLTSREVTVDILQSGEHAGSPESPVIYPDPSSPAYTVASDGVRYASLSSLLAFKIASGVWGHRPRDLADAQELIKRNSLQDAFARELPVPLHDKFRELVAAARAEREIE